MCDGLDGLAGPRLSRGIDDKGGNWTGWTGWTNWTDWTGWTLWTGKTGWTAMLVPLLL